MRILSRATVTVRRILDAVLIALILVVLFAVILGKVVPLTGRQTIIVGGRSMEPAIAMGSAIVVAPVPASQLRVGDVVSLRAGEDRAMFTHRIVQVLDRPDGISIRTKGDANANPDPTLVPAADVEGRVQLTIPMAGYLLAVLSIPAGVLFLIGLAATLLAAIWLLESFELDRADRRRVRLASGVATDLGEPIPGRVIAPTLAAGGVFGSARLTIAEQLALSRETRRRREQWRTGAKQRSDRAGD